MKMFIVLLLIITVIYCSYDSCENEDNYTKCSSHTIDELAGFSCHLFSSNVDTEGDLDSEQYCNIFPDSYKNQKILCKIEKGYAKEYISIHPENIDIFNDAILEPQKEFYEKNETIIFKKKLLSNEEIAIIRSNNTCFYQYYQYIGRFKNNSSENYNFKDKNICFNTIRFPELKDLINCGYAGKIFTLNTCFFIPDNHLPNDFQIFFSKRFIESEALAFTDDLDNKQKIFPGTLQLIKRKKEKGRKLEDDELKYEITIEDKYGKIYKYTDKSLEPEVIEEGTQGDQSYDDDNSINVSYNCSGNDFFMSKCIPNNITSSSYIIVSDYIYKILDDIEKGKFNEIFNNTIAENKTYTVIESNITYIISKVSSQYSTNYSTVSLEYCESLLKEKFLLDKNETLILLKLEYGIKKLKI